MKIKENIKLILKESYRWRNRELLEEKKGFVEPALSRKALFKSNFILFVISIAISLYFGVFFNSDFAGYTITSLSIFIGLFATILILVFDKFISNKNLDNLKDASSDLKLNLKRTKNFSRRFVFISLEGLLIAICIIILLLFPLMLKDSFTIDILKYRFSFSDIDLDTSICFLKNLVVLIIRVLLVVFFFKFFKYLFIIFGYLGEYIKGVFDNKVKI